MELHLYPLVLRLHPSNQPNREGTRIFHLFRRAPPIPPPRWNNAKSCCKIDRGRRRCRRGAESEKINARATACHISSSAPVLIKFSRRTRFLPCVELHNSALWHFNAQLYIYYTRVYTLVTRARVLIRAMQVRYWTGRRPSAPLILCCASIERVRALARDGVLGVYSDNGQRAKHLARPD